MHYYQFNIGDYLKSTQHLSEMEDLAYRRLLDLSYDTEKPLVADINKILRLIRMKSYKTETQQILDEFFKLTKKGYIQKRVKKELDKYSLRAQTARDNGKLGGRPVGTQRVNSGNPVETQRKAKQETRNKKHKTNNKEKDKEKKRFKKPTPAQLVECFGNRVINPEEESGKFWNHYESNGWRVGRNPMKSWQHAVTNWITRSKSNANTDRPYQSKSDRADEAVRTALERIQSQGG